MTLRSRSCVIGRGVWMFSICSAMALASKTPTQIGSTFCPSRSRRMMIGMLVIGSTINPLIVISTSARCRLRIDDFHGSSVLRRQPYARARARSRQADRVDRLAPDAVRTGALECPHRRTGRPTSARPGRLTTVFPVVRPETSQSRRRLRESTSTSTRRPTVASCSSCWMRRCSNCSPRIRRVLTSSGTSSGSRFDASVFGRSEYLNENML